MENNIEVSDEVYNFVKDAAEKRYPISNDDDLMKRIMVDLSRTAYMCGLLDGKRWIEKGMNFKK